MFYWCQRTHDPAGMLSLAVRRDAVPMGAEALGLTGQMQSQVAADPLYAPNSKGRFGSRHGGTASLRVAAPTETWCAPLTRCVQRTLVREVLNDVEGPHGGQSRRACSRRCERALRARRSNTDYLDVVTNSTWPGKHKQLRTLTFAP